MAEQKLVPMYDPTIGAFRDVPLERAKAFLESTAALAEAVAKAEEEEKDAALLAEAKAAKQSAAAVEAPVSNPSETPQSHE